MMVPRDKPMSFDPNGIIPTDLRPETGPGLVDVVGAAFRQENVVGSALAYQWSTNERADGYNAWDEIKGTPYEQYWDRFVESNNPG